MSWFGWFARRDRRRPTPENADRRAQIDALRLEHNVVSRVLVETQRSTTEARSQQLDPRIRRVEVLADVLYRQHVAAVRA